jgi:phage terminase large subunit-like protein
MSRKRPSRDAQWSILTLAAVEAELARDRELAATDVWRAMARPEQLPPEGGWRTWLLMTGRGWGKTRTAAETIAARVRDGLSRRIAVVARTEADLRNTALPALVAAAGPVVESIESKFLIRWANGAEAQGFSAAEPDSLRGQEFDTAWCDEVASWIYPDAYDQLQLALRVGSPHVIVTTTPRPVPLVRRILDDPGTIVTRGSTFDNAAHLAPEALRYYRDRYTGTRLGRQELEGELLDDVEGALWRRDKIDELRVLEPPELGRIVVAVDPAITSGPAAGETAIVVVAKGSDGHGYVLEDLSGRYTPDTVARVIADGVRRRGADRVVAETNQGGDLVEALLRTVDPSIPYKAVVARHGKRIRAEPIAALYEQGKVHHVGGFPELEDQLCAALPDGGGGPDDRLDALVWGLTELDLTASVIDYYLTNPDFVYGICHCASCGRGFKWGSKRPCPWCGVLAPAEDPAALGSDAPPAPDDEAHG